VYFAVFHPEAGGRYSVTFPDVPGAISEGDDFYEAFQNARDALEALLESLVMDGEPLPQARPPEAIVDEAQGALVSAIEAEVESKTVRINVSLGERLLTQIDRAAERSGHTRSGFLVYAARKLLDEEQNSTIRERNLRVVTAPPTDETRDVFGALLRTGREGVIMCAPTDEQSHAHLYRYEAPHARKLMLSCSGFFGAGEELRGPIPDPLNSVEENEILTVTGNRAFKHRPATPFDEVTTASAQARRPSS
jgi:predicted RNase H-like HicB family nuclease